MAVLNLRQADGGRRVGNGKEMLLFGKGAGTKGGNSPRGRLFGGYIFPLRTNKLMKCNCLRDISKETSEIGIEDVSACGVTRVKWAPNLAALAAAFCSFCTEYRSSFWISMSSPSPSLSTYLSH